MYVCTHVKGVCVRLVHSWKAPPFSVTIYIIVLKLIYNACVHGSEKLKTPKCVVKNNEQVYKICEKRMKSVMIGS